jgi:PAS domain S-box-containing protein
MEPGWSIVIIMAVFVLLALGISGGAIVHGRRIRESEKRFYHLFDRVFDALIFFDQDWDIISVNESACELLGYTKKEFIKLKIGSLVSRRKWHRLRTEFEKTLKSGLDFLGATELNCRNGDIIKVDIGATRIVMNGGTYILASIRDISERQKAEESLREKNIALKEILAHLEEEKLRIKKEHARAIDQVLIPTANRVLEKDGTVNKAYYDSLKSALKDLSASTGGSQYTSSKLTPREVQICNLIKSGATSKEIAEVLHLSITTILKHRGRIRRKLNISNKDINLGIFLSNLE